MAGIQIGTASRADDPALCRLIAETPMKGRISLSFMREPSYFGALEVEGDTSDIIVARDEQSRIVAMGNRSFRNLLIDDRPTEVGYLSGLRVAPRYRNGSILYRGYRYLQDLDRERRVRFYLTTIVEDNESAIRALAGRRKGMPVYHDLGRFYSLALSMTQSQHGERSNGLTVRTADLDDMSRITRYLSKEGGKKQFFPVYAPDQPVLRGLRPEDIFLAFHRDELCGVAALWDQSAFRQILVHDYAFPLKQLRPLYNTFASPLGLPPFPPAGSQLSCLYLSLVCVKDNDAAIFRTLLQALCGSHGSREAVLLGGFHERDPLLTAIRKYHHIQFVSRVYAVSWDGDAGNLPMFDENKIPYLELGTL